MVFDATRPDRERLVRMPFGDAWLDLVDPADLASCDVMDVRTRLGMYRLLVERLNGNGAFGTHDEQSPFWGYASQLAWQHRSGRLGGATYAIADGSWWGACNYALCVVPYAAAMQRGLVPSLRFTMDRSYDSVIPAWHRAVDAMSQAVTRGDHDRVRVAVWQAHLAAISLAVKNHIPELSAMPAAEQRFARGWVRMVDLFAAAACRTDLDKLVETGGGALPSRMLRDRDRIVDLHRDEARTVMRVGVLADRPRWRWAIEMRVWRRIMRTSRGRADAEYMLASAFGKGNQVWPVRARALAYATLPSRVVERIGAP